MLPSHPMQLTPEYHAKLGPAFLPWYLKTFTSDRRVYGHWSVSGYCSPDAAYHREILLHPDGHIEVANPAGVDLMTDLGGHTDGRNRLPGGAIAICIGSLDRTTSTAHTLTALGGQPPTKAEVEAFVEETVRICLNCHIPVSNLMTHAEAANNLDFPSTDADGIPAPPSYGPGSADFQRWDLHVQYNPATGQMEPLFDGSTALYPRGRVPHGPINAREYLLPDGWVYFPDWWRGQVALGVQTATKAKWST